MAKAMTKILKTDLKFEWSDEKRIKLKKMFSIQTKTKKNLNKTKTKRK